MKQRIGRNRIGQVGAVLVALAALSTACSSSAKKPATTTPAATGVAPVVTTGASTDISPITSANSIDITPVTSGNSIDVPIITSANSTDIPVITTGASTDIPTVTTGGATSGVTTAGISAAECAANKAAGKITYISSFDFSASASIIDVIVAKDKGYFDKMCLDVTLRSGFSTTNYPIVAAGTAQFSSAGNYTEILNFSKDGAKFVALVDYGKAPIEALITKDGGATSLDQLKGKTIGVKGDIPPSIVAMLAEAGLVRGKDYKEVLLDGFDPQAQLKQDIDALPVYKSNEPGQLDRAGVKYNLFDPAKMDIPGSFGIIYTSADFAAKHPTAAADFARASLEGMQAAIADPDAAVATAFKLVTTAGNPNFLTMVGETYRLNQEIAVVKASTPAGEGIGQIDPSVFDNEYSSYVAAGVWPQGPPVDGKDYDAALSKSLFDSSGNVIWPAS
ncbi:MAG TPA: ABC transporter substrate-binding protein [Ilumatobacteraceae bacterium]